MNAQTTSSVPPPEDTVSSVNRGFSKDVKLKTVLHVGDGLFGSASGSVCNTAMRFRYGDTNVLIDLWSAPLSVPLFTIQAYDTSAVVVSLSEDDVFLEKTCRLAEMAVAVVSLDGSCMVEEFARHLHLPLFVGEAGFYWCVHYLLTI